MEVYVHMQVIIIENILHIVEGVGSIKQDQYKRTDIIILSIINFASVC